MAGGHRSNNKKAESKSDLLHNSNHTLSETEERSHSHGKEKDQRSIVCYVFGCGSIKVQHVSVKPLIETVGLSLIMFSVCISPAMLVVAMVLL